jgi:hypothetical protein
MSAELDRGKEEATIRGFSTCYGGFCASANLIRKVLASKRPEYFIICSSCT